jgi:glutathione S-transferase
VHFSETISQHTAALTQQHVALYDDTMRSPVVMRLEAKRIEKCYGALERRLIGRAYVLDRGFSAADIGVAQALYMARHFAKSEPFPALTSWYDRVTARPAFKKALPPKRAEMLYKKEFYEAWDG